MTQLAYYIILIYNNIIILYIILYNKLYNNIDITRKTITGSFLKVSWCISMGNWKNLLRNCPGESVSITGFRKSKELKTIDGKHFKPGNNSWGAFNHPLPLLDNNNKCLNPLPWDINDIDFEEGMITVWVCDSNSHRFIHNNVPMISVNDITKAVKLTIIDLIPYPMVNIVNIYIILSSFFMLSIPISNYNYYDHNMYYLYMVYAWHFRTPTSVYYNLTHHVH